MKESRPSRISQLIPPSRAVHSAFNSPHQLTSKFCAIHSKFKQTPDLKVNGSKLTTAPNSTSPVQNFKHENPKRIPTILSGAYSSAKKSSPSDVKGRPLKVTQFRVESRAGFISKILPSSKSIFSIGKLKKFTTPAANRSITPLPPSFPRIVSSSEVPLPSSKRETSQIFSCSETIIQQKQRTTLESSRASTNEEDPSLCTSSLLEHPPVYAEKSSRSYVFNHEVRDFGQRKASMIYMSNSKLFHSRHSSQTREILDFDREFISSRSLWPDSSESKPRLSRRILLKISPQKMQKIGYTQNLWNTPPTPTLSTRSNTYRKHSLSCTEFPPNLEQRFSQKSTDCPLTDYISLLNTERRECQNCKRVRCCYGLGKTAESGLRKSITQGSVCVFQTTEEGSETTSKVKGIVSPEMCVIKIIQIRMTSHGPPSLPKPSYIRSQNRAAQMQQLGTSFQGMSSSAMIAPTVSERKVSEEYMKRMGMKNLGNMKHFSSKFKNAIAAPYFVTEDSGTPLASRMSRPYTRGPQNSSLGHHQDSRFRQTASNSSQPPPHQDRSFQTHDLGEVYRGRPRDVFQPSTDQNLSSRPLTSQVERHSHSRQSKSPGVKPFEVPSHTKKKMTPAQQLGIVEIELKKARGEYYQGLRQLLKMETDFQNKFSLRAHLQNIKRICEGGLELDEIQQRLGSFDDTLSGLERLTENLFTSKQNSQVLEPRREAPSRTTSLKISQIVQENKNLKFTHFSQTKCFLHIQKVDDALLFYIYHKYASKPVLAKSEMTEDKLELEELVGSLMLVATDSGAVTVRRAEDQWDTRLKSSNPYVNRVQNNILMYSPNSSDSINFGKPVFVPPIYNFYLEKRDHQHNLRIKYINGKTKEESPELPTYFLDPEIHIPKSVINCARHVRKFIKRKIRVKHRNTEPYVELLQNEDDQSHLTRFQIHYAPQILDNFEDIKTQHNLSLLLQNRHTAQMKAKDQEEDDELVKPQLESLISKILRTRQVSFLSPGCLLLIQDNYVFVQLAVDELNNEGWLVILQPRANDVGVLMKEEIEQIMQQESELKKIKIYPAQTQILSAPLLLIANRWHSIHDIKASPTTFLRSLETRQLLQELLNGEGYE